jgi:wyosine [tRNA(Phe)-imidazoG37] synthetase (radical SAM superfamily)
MHIVFGPVNSRRFGLSLGIDLSPSKKQCNFDCLYCELAPAKTVGVYDEVVPLEEVVAEVKKALNAHPRLDYLTVTANGEPTLYPHLEALIDTLNDIKGDAKTLILSNASTVNDKKVRRALMKFDEVKLSLDCATQRCLKRLDRARAGIDVEAIKQGIRDFAASYKGRLVIEVLFVKSINDTDKEIAELDAYLSQLRPDRIDIGTVDRPPAYDVEALDYDMLMRIARKFDASLPVYIASRKDGATVGASYNEKEILETLAMRPLTKEDIRILFDDATQKLFSELLEEGKIAATERGGVLFYKIA